MSNIYDALVQAQHEQKIPPHTPLSPEGGGDAFPLQEPVELAVAPHALEREVAHLYRSVEAALKDRVPAVLQFIGARGGEGVSTVLREFAKIGAAQCGKKVLILDAAHHHPTQHLHFKSQCGYGWLDALRENGPLVEACYQVGKSSLYLSPISLQPSLPLWHRTQEATASFFSALKGMFDLVLIDAAPAAASPDGIAISRFADGVILVVEAERTNWIVAQSVKEAIAKNGGTILGVAFNKRRYYIPRCIYRYLQ